MENKLIEHVNKPILNWWHDTTWMNWFQELKEITSNSSNQKLLNHINKVEYPEHLHHSRWRLWYDDLLKIVRPCISKETE